MHQMWFKLLDYRIWIRDVFWLGFWHPRCWDPIAIYISNPDLACWGQFDLYTVTVCANEKEHLERDGVCQ